MRTEHINTEHIETEYIETVIVGAGQAGLATGYHLQRAGRPFVILDGESRVGDGWRNQWDTLRLFSPAWADQLPGLPHPALAGRSRRRTSSPTTSSRMPPTSVCRCGSARA